MQRLVMKDRSMAQRLTSKVASISIGTVNAILIEDLKRLNEKMRKKRLQKWRSDQWWFQWPKPKLMLVTIYRFKMKIKW